MLGIGAGIAGSIMRAIDRFTSYDPQNTSRITSAADTIERTIMVVDMAATAKTIMVMNTATIGKTIMVTDMATIDTTISEKFR
jgi:hypothetical protein